MPVGTIHRPSGTPLSLSGGVEGLRAFFFTSSFDMPPPPRIRKTTTTTTTYFDQLCIIQKVNSFEETFRNTFLGFWSYQGFEDLITYIFRPLICRFDSVKVKKKTEFARPIIYHTFL